MRVAGLSAQPLDDQLEFAERNGMPFPVIADPGLELGAAIGLPTFEIEGHVLYKRLALVAEERADRQGLLSRLPARRERRRRARLAAPR